MNRPSLLLALASSAIFSAAAQDRIYRCGNEYTNMVVPGQESKCTLITTGNVTVVPATRVPPASAKSTGPRADAGAQRAKDAEARTILETELRKAEAQLAALQQEYKQGEPDRQGDETRNYQKYQDRKADLKAKVERTEADVASLRRELARLSPSLAAAP
jgi:hypothetical protein